MTTAFVLSDGASLGAVQVGMLQALTERNISPDLLVGTSAGALNAAYLSGAGATEAGVASLAEVWDGLTARSLFPFDPIRALGALVGRSNALFSDRGLRTLMRRHLRFELLEDAPIPLVIVATEFSSGREVALSDGDAVDAILASSAIPGVFPPVVRGEHTLVDGALADNTAISQAVLAGADTIYVLPTGYSCDLPEPPRTPLAAATHALAILTHQRLVADIARYSDAVDLVVFPPPCPLRVSPINFGQSAELIGTAYAAATDLLAHDGGRRSDPAADVAMHTHHR